MNLSDLSEASGFMSVKEVVGGLIGRKSDLCNGPRGLEVIGIVCLRSVAAKKVAIFDEYSVYAI